MLGNMDVMMTFIQNFRAADPVNEYQRNYSRRAQRVCYENERSNLLAITQLILNAFLNDQIRGTKTRFLDEIETREISDLFISLEKCLWHGFKTSMQTSFIGKRKTPESEIWHFLGLVSKTNPNMGELYSSVCELANLRTPLSKFRAFLRLSMMQKTLAKYFECFYESEITNDFYEPWAFIKAESFTFLFGSLLSLNIFDCNLLIDHDQLQEQINSFDISPYFRLPSIPCQEGNLDENEAQNVEFKRILDQKQYLEERNSQLSSNIDQLKCKLEKCEANGKMNSSEEPETTNDRSLIFTERLKDMEKEREILKARLTEKEDNLRSSQEQLEGTRRFTKDLYEKLRAADGKIKQTQKDMNELKEMYESEIGQLLNSLKSLKENELAKNEEFGEKEEEEDSISKNTTKLREELATKTENYSNAMAALKRKHEELSSERENGEALKRHCAELEARIEVLNCVEKELNAAKEENKKSKLELADARQALQEFSQALSESKLRMVELKDEIMPPNEAKWVKENEANGCKLCDIQFSMVQRRHHCRNCGQIFCNSCASSRVKLPSNPNPVRVCMNCFRLLRNRQHSSSTTSSDPCNSLQ